MLLSCYPFTTQQWLLFRPLPTSIDYKNQLDLGLEKTVSTLGANQQLEVNV